MKEYGFDQNPLANLASFGNNMANLQARQQANKVNEYNFEQQQASDAALQDALSTGDYSRLDPRQQQQFMQIDAMKKTLVDKDAGRTAFSISTALKNGDIETAQRIAIENADDINAIGDPNFTADKYVQLMQQDPEQAISMANGVMHVTGFDSGLPKPMTEYQRGQLQARDNENQLSRDNLKYKKERDEINDQIKQDERKEKVLENRLKKETNELKKQEIEFKLNDLKDKNKEKKRTDNERIDNALYSAKNQQNEISGLLKNNEFLDSIEGYSGRKPNSLKSTGDIDANQALNTIKSSLTIDNLKVMSGPLTDKDIEVITNAATKLRAGMSKSELEKELKKISSAYDRIIENYEKEKKSKGYDFKSVSDQDKNNKFKGDENLSDEELIKRYSPK